MSRYGVDGAKGKTMHDRLMQLCSHKYRQLPLIPVEEFLALHPEHADADENALVVARIDHEREEREALELQRGDLSRRKAKLIAENKKRKDDLTSLDEDLEKFIDVRSAPCLPRSEAGTNRSPGRQTNPATIREEHMTTDPVDRSLLETSAAISPTWHTSTRAYVLLADGSLAGTLGCLASTQRAYLAVIPLSRDALTNVDGMRKRSMPNGFTMNPIRWRGSC
jgi:hypothetical protein